MLQHLCIGAAIVMGVAAEANGLFMLISPEHWYFAVPGVTTTGPFNQHFIRDIGLIFLFVGTAFLVGAAKPQYRVVLWAAPTLWLGGHALFHFWEVAVGIGPAARFSDRDASRHHRDGPYSLGGPRRWRPAERRDADLASHSLPQAVQ